MTKPFNVVVWGSSGFTGRLVCEHIARDYKGQFSWALAGRSQAKLEGIRADLAERYGADIADVPILIGALDDQASLDAIACQADVIISTAGPFAIHGTPIVAAAVKNSSHYVDITGEVPWVKSLITAYHEEAKAKGVRIVPCCGYDSIPSDLGAMLVVDHIQRHLKKEAASVTSAVMEGRGGVSGGTIATGMYQFSQQSKGKGSGVDGTSTYALIPEGQAKGTDADVWGVAYNDTLKAWMAPFVMQACNTRVVHRSNYLLGWGGPAFSYAEVTTAPSWAAAKAVAVGTAAIVATFSRAWLHPLLRKMLPAPGQGPSRDQMLNGFYSHSVVGVTREPTGAAPDIVVAEFGDPSRDPGYWGTSRMVLEAGLALALQRDALDADAGLQKGGVLTPASALGGVLAERLRGAGLTLKVKEVRVGGVETAAAAVVAK